MRKNKLWRGGCAKKAQYAAHRRPTSDFPEIKKLEQLFRKIGGAACQWSPLHSMSSERNLCPPQHIWSTTLSSPLSESQQQLPCTERDLRHWCLFNWPQSWKHPIISVISIYKKGAPSPEREGGGTVWTEGLPAKSVHSAGPLDSRTPRLSPTEVDQRAIRYLPPLSLYLGRGNEAIHRAFQGSVPTCSLLFCTKQL